MSGCFLRTYCGASGCFIRLILEEVTGFAWALEEEIGLTLDKKTGLEEEIGPAPDNPCLDDVMLSNFVLGNMG